MEINNLLNGTIQDCCLSTVEPRMLLFFLDLVSDDASLANAFSDAEPDVDFGHDKRVLGSLRRSQSHDVYIKNRSTGFSP